MPGSIGCRQIVLLHWLSTARAFGCKEAVEIPRAIWFTISLQKPWKRQIHSVQTVISQMTTRSADSQNVVWDVLGIRVLINCFSLIDKSAVVSPSGPNRSPQWLQKKCSGCHVWSIAVRMFCAKHNKWSPAWLARIIHLFVKRKSGKSHSTFIYLS